MVLGRGAWGQDAPASSASEQPASQPTTAPATQNPLRSPASMMAYFESAIADGRLQDAQRCLNLSRVDPEIVKEQGATYATQLAEILTRLVAEGYFDSAALPDDPTAPSQTIGADPLLLVLQRYEYEPAQPVETQPAVAAKPPKQLCWQFAEATVADVPDLYDQLDELIGKIKSKSAAAAEAPPEDKQDVGPLRSPYHTVQRFFVSVGNAKNDSAAYADAMACLDFSQVDVTDFETRTDYVDNLYAILEHLRAIGQLDLKALPQTPEGDAYPIGDDPYQVILVRGMDGCWRFRARTVAGIPDMIARLEAERTQQKAESGESAGPAAVAPPEMLRDTSSPQATLNLFMNAMNEQDLATAVTCLDLSQAMQADRSVAEVLAGKLWLVLNRRKVIVLQEVPNDPESAAPYSVIKEEAGQVWINKQRRGPRAGEWLFTAASLREVDALYKEFEKKPVLSELRNWRISFWALPSLYVREYLVPDGVKWPLCGLEAWQWMGLAAVLLLGLALRQLSRYALPRISRRLLQTETAAVLPQTVRKALTPTATLAMVVAWWGGLQFLDLGAAVMGWTWWLLKIVMVLVGVVAFYRLIDLVMAYFAARAAQTASRLDDVLVPLVQKTLKVVAVAFGILFIAKAFGFQITPLLAGLGVGGLAFGLAAQDTLKNFFGSVNVVLDRPFQVGDWIQVGDVEGTVESVGLRSSRIRTFYNSQVTVPNSDIMVSKVDNLGRRRFRRISCMISVTYSTPPEKLEAFCEGIRELIRRHPYTRKDYYHTWVNKFAASSIDILLYCFHECPEWGTELRERHRLFLDIIRLAQRLGVEFAFPTQTVHVHHDSSPADAPPPPASSVPTGAEQAIRFGAEEAQRIAEQTFPEDTEKPPPVTY